MTVKLNVARLKQFLKDEGPASVDLKQIVKLAEVLTDSMKDVFASYDKQIHSDLAAIANQISDTKSELANFHAAEMEKANIPEAGVELDAVVEATENATETIMAAAEEIMCADPSDHEAYSAVVNDKIIEIFEACSFQDITGQRISKVVKTLESVDKQINHLLSHFDTDGEEWIEEEIKTHRDQETKDGLLNGPQAEDKAVKQDAIDDLFS